MKKYGFREEETSTLTAGFPIQFKATALSSLDRSAVTFLFFFFFFCGNAVTFLRATLLALVHQEARDMLKYAVRQQVDGVIPTRFCQGRG